MCIVPSALGLVLRGCWCWDLDSGSDEDDVLTILTLFLTSTVMISVRKFKCFHKFQFSHHAGCGFSQSQIRTLSADEVEISTHLLGPGHSVDHDVCEAVPPPTPTSEAATVEPNAVVPVERLLGVLALNTT